MFLSLLLSFSIRKPLLKQYITVAKHPDICTNTTNQQYSSTQPTKPRKNTSWINSSLYGSKNGDPQ